MRGRAVLKPAHIATGLLPNIPGYLTACVSSLLQPEPPHPVISLSSSLQQLVPGEDSGVREQWSLLSLGQGCQNLTNYGPY